MRLLNGNNTEVKLVKETFLVRAAKPLAVALIMSIGFNAGLIFAAADYSEHVRQMANALEVTNKANVELKDKLATTTAAYQSVQAKYSKALVPEATVAEAMQNHVVEPVRSGVINAALNVKKGAVLSANFVKTKAEDAWHYVSR